VDIIICIKQVPDTAEVKIDPVTNTLIREGVKSIINPFDMYAVEEGIRLKEKYGGRVTVLTMGPPQAEEALREAISLGCDEAVLISDRAFAGSDTLATSSTLAKAIEKIGRFDLIICGKQAADGDTAQVGPGVSAHLDIPQVTYVKKIEEIRIAVHQGTRAPGHQSTRAPGHQGTRAPGHQGTRAPGHQGTRAPGHQGTRAPGHQSPVTSNQLPITNNQFIARVERMMEEGYEVIETPLPCLITVVKEINEPRLPSLKGKLKARSASIPRWSAQDLGIEKNRIGLEGSPTKVIKIFTPPPRKGGQVLTGETKEVVGKLVELLKAEI
jgi:electron transfer flavoprotein beta subunit